MRPQARILTHTARDIQAVLAVTRRMEHRWFRAKEVTCDRFEVTFEREGWFVMSLCYLLL